jgi:hypothetical protein
VSVVGLCREHGIKLNIAQIKGRKVAGRHGRTTGSVGYQISHKVHKRSEEVFGRAKEIGGLRRRCKRHMAGGCCSSSDYNLVRRGRLLGNTT